MLADLEKIEKLLEEMSGYKISKETGIAQSTVSGWQTGKVKLEDMKFKHAAALTSLYDQFKS